jgi:hypothetical protein
MWFKAHGWVLGAAFAALQHCNLFAKPAGLAVQPLASTDLHLNWRLQGRPIYVDRLGHLNLGAIEKLRIPDKDVVRLHIQEMEVRPYCAPFAVGPQAHSHVMAYTINKDKGSRFGNHISKSGISRLDDNNTLRVHTWTCCGCMPWCHMALPGHVTAHRSSKDSSCSCKVYIRASQLHAVRADESGDGVQPASICWPELAYGIRAGACVQLCGRRGQSAV